MNESYLYLSFHKYARDRITYFSKFQTIIVCKLNVLIYPIVIDGFIWVALRSHVGFIGVAPRSLIASV